MRTKFEIKHFVLGAILLIGATFRFTGLNWDQGHNLHPDERFLVMVGTGVTWPKNISEYLDTTKSPLNPHNNNFNFYVYGTFPILVTKVVTELVGRTDFDSFVLVGRFISALLDTSIVLLIYKLTKKLTSNEKISILSSFAYSSMVLPIQLSHFFATDTFMVFFAIFSFWLLLRRDIISISIGGIFLGLSISSKISTVVMFPVICILFALTFIKSSQKIKVFFSGLSFIFFVLITIRIAYPYLFLGGIIPSGLNQQVLSNWKELKSYENPEVWFPPAVMWHGINNKPLYALENLILWGVGLPTGAAIVFGLFIFIANYKKYLQLSIPLSVISSVFLYQATQFNIPMRYLYITYPFLAIFSGLTLSFLSKGFVSNLLIVILVLLWPLSFVSIYSHPHPRLSASEWIRNNIPSGSSISCEYWDDCLPLGQGNPFNIVQISPYDPETPQKWKTISEKLAELDYIILSSNRLYGSIPSWPKRYPLTSEFYKKLFAGELGFKKTAEFSSRPNLPIPGLSICISPPGIAYGSLAHASQECSKSGISLVDDYADETFTVYDHPKVIIFKRN